jgi:hypothetical protein
MANINSLISQRNALLSELASLQISLNQAQINNPNLVDGIEARIIDVEIQIQELSAQISALQFPTASAGNLVNDDQQARAPDSLVVAPNGSGLLLNNNGRITQPPDTSSSTNALSNQTALSVDTGTDGDLRPLTETQSVSPVLLNESNSLLLDPNVDGREEVSYSIGGTPGAGSPSDDAGTAAVTRAEIDAIFNESPIVAQENILDKFASYTYQASVYLCSPEKYNELIQSKRKSVTGLQLLFQSGGAPEVGRSPYFSNDYYIDNINIVSKIVGKGTGAAHGTSEIKMTVIEPNGITFIDNIDRAVQQYLGSEEAKKKNFTAAIYLLVIRFYGYDDQGNLVRGGVPDPAGQTDRNAFVEKFYPFCLANVAFKIQSKAVEYQLDCKPVIDIVALSDSHGTIPFNIELSGQTLRDLFSGPAQYINNQAAVNAGGNGVRRDQVGTYNYATGEFDNTGAATPAAPAKANAAPTNKKTVRKGLVAALNDYQQELVRQQKYNIANEYVVEFANESIANARVIKSGSTVKKSTPMASNGNDPSAKLDSKQSMDKNSRNVSATAGIQLVQFLDQVVRNSSFMEDQQVVIIDEQSQEQKATGTPAKNLAWFKISCETEIIAYDQKRNDYAYRIKYIIHAYKINSANSRWFPLPQFNGAHKRYNYWFTGQNTQVISYEETLNALYKVILSGSLNVGSQAASELIKYNAQTRSGESAQGAEGKANEASANLAEQLYSPSDLKECNMTIVGDPAWLQQGDMFAGFGLNDPGRFRSFLPDGAINVDGQQPIFEVAFNKPVDYDLNTGLLNPNQQTSPTSDSLNRQSGTAGISRLYYARECRSQFNRGKFTQQLQGVLVPIDPNRVAQANREISSANQQLALQQTVQRALSTANSGQLITALYNNALLGDPGLTNLAKNFGINVTNANLINGLFGTASTRNSPAPTNPTSFGLSVGATTLNTINLGNPNQPSLATPSFVGGADQSEGGTVQGTTQTMSPSDDAGGPQLLNEEE